MTPVLRALAWFWAGVVVVTVLVAVSLRFAGRPSPPVKTVAAIATPVESQPRPTPAVSKAVALPTPVPPVAVAAPPAVAAAPPPPAPVPALMSASNAIAATDPMLEEPAPDYIGKVLPRVGADGRMPMRVYAAAGVPAQNRPRIAILLTGIGLSAAEDEEALNRLPAAVSFAVSPYAYQPDGMLQKMRERRHEIFLSLPMEPQSFPIDDPGPEALLTGNTEDINRQRLEWAMSRIAGYVGVTGAMGALRGERFAGSPTQMIPVLRELGSRGLMYVDARPGMAPRPGAIERSVDVVIDAPAVRSETDARLAQLETAARDHGSAIGLAGPPHPVIVERLAIWAATLAGHGFTLVPVSTLVTPELSAAEAVAVKP